MSFKRKKLGGGAFGIVYSAQLIPSMELVAIKSFHAKDSNDSGIDTSILREICILKRLNHPHIIRLRSVSFEPQIEIIMDNGGQTLGDFIKKTSLSERCKKSSDIEQQIISGLAYMHSLGFAHRDIKPSNILIDDKLIVRLCDLGLATPVSFGNALPKGDASTLLDVSRRNRKLTSCVGSRWYRAPEMFNNTNYTTAVDVWGLGCVLYELIVGQPIFKGPTDLAVISAILKTVPTQKDVLDTVGLGMINIDTCNCTPYFRIKPLYSDVLDLDITMRLSLDQLKLRIESMLVLLPESRIVLPQFGHAQTVHVSAPSPVHIQYIGEFDFIPMSTALDLLNPYVINLAQKIFKFVIYKISESEDAMIRRDGVKRAETIAIISLCTSAKFLGYKHIKYSEAMIELLPSVLKTEGRRIQPEMLIKWEVFALQAVDFRMYEML